MKIRTASTAAITLATMLALSGCVVTTGSGGGMPGMGSGDNSSPRSETANANSADIMFVSMMIEHHEQAVEMSDTILSKPDIDERVVSLAEQIKAAQEPEIRTMERWLDEWGTGMSGMDGMNHGNGMMSEEDLQALEDASGTEASRLFLEQMIEHHEGAIDMAKDAVEDGRNSEVVALAETIIQTQTNEIATMEEILTTL